MYAVKTLYWLKFRNERWTVNSDSKRQIVLDIQRATPSPRVDVQTAASFGSSHGQCVDMRPARCAARQPFASIGNLTPSNHVTRQQQLRELTASETRSTDCVAPPLGGVLRRVTTVQLHSGNTSTPILVSWRFAAETRTFLWQLRCITIHAH